MKLLVCDPMDPEAVAAMRDAGIKVDVRDTIIPEELEKAIADYEAIVVRSRTKVRAPLIDKATRLRLIIRGGVGLDNIDADYARSKGITVANTPRANSNAVAELVIGLMFALARRIPYADTTMKAGRWEKKTLEGSELAGKTLGVVGCGRIGCLVGHKAAALGMEVLGCDVCITEDQAGIQMMPLEDLLPRSDYVSLHVALTPETRGMIGAPQFAMMKSGVYLINAARGGVVDEAALYDALVSGKVAGAALDVFSEEPPQSDALQRLIQLPQVIATPHIGAATAEALARVGGEVAQIAIEFARRG